VVQFGVEWTGVRSRQAVRVQLEENTMEEDDRRGVPPLCGSNPRLDRAQKTQTRTKRIG
jgi:hypothetical protein